MATRPLVSLATALILSSWTVSADARLRYHGGPTSLDAVSVENATSASGSVPSFNPQPGCRAASAIDQSLHLAVSQDFKTCMADEDSAKQQLVVSWSGYSETDKRRCVGQTEDGGVPSYVEVLECLLVTVGVEVVRDSRPQTRTAKKASPSN